MPSMTIVKSCRLFSEVPSVEEVLIFPVMKFKIKSIVLLIIVLNDQAFSHETCPNVKSSENVLHRKKRALKFPEGSNFVMTNSLVKTLLVGLPLGWNFLMEMDSLFKSPGLADLFLYKFKRFRLHNRQKRELFQGIENSMNMHNIDGKNCLLRSICEAKYLLRPENENFYDDVLRILLKVPEDKRFNKQYIEASKEEDCDKYSGIAKCPLSLIQALQYSERII